MLKYIWQGYKVLLVLILELIIFGDKSLANVSDVARPLQRLVVESRQPFLSRKMDGILICSIAEDSVGGTIEKLNNNNNGIILTEVQWLKDGGILDQTNPDVNVNGVVLQLYGTRRPYEREGIYQCQSTLKSERWKEIGPILSAPYRLQETRIEKFSRRNRLDPVSVQMESIEVIQGEIAFLPCLGRPKSVPEPPRIYFERKLPAGRGGAEEGKRKNLVQIRWDRIGEVFQDRYLLTNEGLQIAVVQPSDSGRYRCLAENRLTNQTRKSKVWVHLRIKETRKKFPASSSSGAILDCVGVGGTVRWEKLNDSHWAVAPKMGHKPRFEQIWGNLKFLEPQTQDSGTYACRLEPPVKDPPDQGGPAPLWRWRPPTAIYHVTVVGEPRAELKLEKTPDAGGQWRLTCSSGERHSVRKPSVYWNARQILNGQTELNIVEYEYNGNGGAAQEKFLLADPLPPGALQCIAPAGEEGWFKWGRVENLHILPLDQRKSTEELVKIEQGPDNTTRSVGDRVSLICRVSGATRVVWLKDDNTIPISADRRFDLIGSGTLDIQNVKLGDTGWYSCVAVGRTKNATARAYLVVEAFFGVRTLPSVNLGDDDFGENEDPIEEDYDDVINQSPPSTSTGPPENWNTEELVPPGASGEGSHEIGSGQTPPMISVETTPAATTTPAPPRGITGKVDKIAAPKVFQHGSDSSMMVQWRVPPSERLPSRIVHFKVQKKEKRSDRWETLDDNLPPNIRQHTVHGLEAGKSYKFRVGVAFANGETLTSRTTRYQKLKKGTERIVAPVLAPKIVETESLSPSAIAVFWTYPRAEKAYLSGFIIQYSIPKRINEDRRRVYNITVEGGSTREHVLDSLVPAAPYEITMVAFNSAGQSKTSEAVIGYTLRQDGTKPLTHFLPTEVPGGPIDPNILMVNATQGEDHLLFRLDSKSLLIFLAALLVLLILFLIICMVYCTLEQRKQTKITMTAKGKFLDTSRRIYKEQRMRDGNMSLFYDAMTVSLTKEGSEKDPLNTSTLLFEPRGSSSQYTPEDPGEITPDRPPTPIVTPVKPLQMQNGAYPAAGWRRGPPPARIYRNPLVESELLSERLRGESSEPEDEVLMALVSPPVGVRAPVPKRRRMEGQVMQEMSGFGLIDSDEDFNGEKQGSTPECDLTEGGSPYDTHEDFVPPPQGMTQTFPVEPTLTSRSYLSPYHHALAATEPTRLGSGMVHIMTPEGSPVYRPGSGQLSMNTSGTTASAGAESSSGSPSLRSRSRTPRGLNLNPPPQILTNQGPALGSAHSGLAPPSLLDGKTSPLIPKSEWDAMWTRGGGSGTNLKRNASDRQAGEPQFYTFRPQSNSANYGNLGSTGSANTYDSRRYPPSNNLNSSAQLGYLSDT